MPRPKSKSLPNILLIAEKPIQGKEIAAALFDPSREVEPLAGGGLLGWTAEGRLLITWAEGHLMEMLRPDDIKPEWGSPWRKEVLPMLPTNHQIPIRARSGMKGRLDSILRWIHESDEVVNACDAGNEGELIFDEIVRHAGHDQDVDKGPKKFSRMWITDTRADAFKAAFADRSRSNLVRFQHIREAARARADADWLYGYNGTRLATLALQRPELPLLVIGRVQTPTLGAVVAIDNEIATFVPERFLIVPLSFRGATGAVFQANLVAFPAIRHGNVDYHFHEVPEVHDIRQELLSTMTVPWKVTDIQEDQLEHAPPPFDLLDLQRSMFRIYGWSASKTLKVAQALYAREKAITYPRTASNKVPPGMREQVEAMREKLYYEWAVSRFEELKGAILPTEDEHWAESGSDHYAILPTGTVPQAWDEGGGLRDEYRLWQLIAVRTILAWLPPARIAVVKRHMMRSWREETVIRAFAEAEPVDDPGWLFWEDKMMNTRGYGKPLLERMREVALPDSGPIARMETLTIRSGSTDAPKYFDEDRLLGWMNRNNLGTPATRHQVIEDLIDYGFLFRNDKGSFRATVEGKLMVGLLNARVGDDVTGITLARQTEEFINRIAGMAKERPTREKLWDSMTAKIKGLAAKLIQTAFDADEAFCPRTGTKVTLHSSGKFYLFDGFKDAKCWITRNGRKMSASDYAAIFSAGDRGGGPFTGFVSQAGNHYDAYLVWRPRKKNFELAFKR